MYGTAGRCDSIIIAQRKGCHSHQMLGWQTPVGIDTHIGINRQAQAHTQRPASRLDTQKQADKGEGTGLLSQKPYLQKNPQKWYFAQNRQITDHIIVYFVFSGKLLSAIMWLLPDININILSKHKLALCSLHSFFSVSTVLKCLVFLFLIQNFALE